VRTGCRILSQVIDAGRRRRSRRRVCVSTKALEGGETQGVDRCLGKNQSWKRRTLQRQSEERLYAACQRTSISRASDIHVRDGAGMIEMGELELELTRFGGHP
jgi:hypothetical protein